MVNFVHPAKADLTLTGVLGALSDPMRLAIVKTLIRQAGDMSCTGAMPCAAMAKSTLSNHFRILREAGLVRTTKKGVEHRNIVREAELEERFPGLLALILSLAD